MDRRWRVSQGRFGNGPGIGRGEVQVDDPARLLAELIDNRKRPCLDNTKPSSPHLASTVSLLVEAETLIRHVSFKLC